MPKRHRQPEPIDIQSAAHRSHHPTTASSAKSSLAQSATASNVVSSTTAVASTSRDGQHVYSPGELKLVEETRKKAMDFPATPETLARHRRQQEADAKRRRVAYDHEGQPVSDTATSATATATATVAGGAEAHKGGFLNGAAKATTANGDAEVREEEEEEAQDGSDLSSQDYIGDDGNQPSTDSELDSDDDSEEGNEAELRGLRRAVAAAAAAQQRRVGGAEQESSSSSDGESGEEDESSDLDSSGLDASEGEFESEEMDDDDEDDSDEESSMDDAEEGDEEDGEVSRSAQHDEDTDEDESGLITVDFGVFDMEASNVDGLIHLMDQLCPDKMNEVDRDELGLALLESPFTSVVRLQNNGEDATGEEEQEFYGLSSLLDVAHGQQLYPKALRPLCTLLRQHVWRQAAPGIPPTDILTSVVDDEHAATSRAKCLLLISEYIRNIPLELTVQILEDNLDRLDAAARETGKAKASTPAGATHEDPIYATQPAMFAVLAKVQRATDAPVTLPKGGKTGDASAASAAAPTAAESTAAPGASKKHPPHGAVASTPETPLDLTHYIFWREEDSILYEFRDKRVAALVYRCRSQYDGQPEHEIPLSIFFVLQYGAVRQAVDEMKRRQTVNASIERY